MSEPFVRKLSKPRGKRVETGAIQFGDDQPGLFMTHPDALYLANILAAAAAGHMFEWEKLEAKRIQDIINRNVRGPGVERTTEEG